MPISAEPLSLSKTDVKIILHAMKAARLFERGMISDRELIASFFHHLAFAQTDHAIVQAAARLPQVVHVTLDQYIATIRDEERPGKLFVFAPHQPTGVEWSDLNERIRHVAEVLKGFLECPVAVRNIAELPCDAKSGFLFHLETVPGTLCRTAGCGLSRATVSVFCPEHHYQMLKKVDASIK